MGFRYFCDQCKTDLDEHDKSFGLRLPREQDGPDDEPFFIGNDAILCSRGCMDKYMDERGL